jgi:hypothetical protein
LIHDKTGRVKLEVTGTGKVTLIPLRQNEIAIARDTQVERTTSKLQRALLKERCYSRDRRAASELSAKNSFAGDNRLEFGAIRLESDRARV